MREMEKNMRKRSRKSLLKRVALQHHYLRRTGFYKTVGGAFLRLMIVVIVIFGILYYAGNYLLNFDKIVDYTVHTLPRWFAYAVFFVSESLFSLLPPDMFIVWTEELPYPWVSVSILGVLSYLAGIVSFSIGSFLRKIKKINDWYSGRYEKHIRNVNKWGGWLILAAALTPLPFSLTVMTTGLMKYPRQRFLLWSLSRIPRFHIYALVLYKAINL